MVEPRVFEDERGYFFRKLEQSGFERTGIDYDFLFQTISQNPVEFGTIRGIHFQKGEFAQAKLVRVLEGTVLMLPSICGPDRRLSVSTWQGIVGGEQKAIDDSARFRS